MPISVRLAEHTDLVFVRQDEYVDATVVARKIDQGEVIVSESDGVPSGYARIEYIWSLRPYLSLIRVVERHRRQGVGTAMLSYLGEMLKSQGHAVLLSSSQVDEPEPQAWHRRMGFRECGIINGMNEGGVGEVFFVKDL
jgi:GNAT superfamily N-acetyltransferase